MPRRLFACTPTRLATFDCPRRYRLTYLDRPTPPRGAPWAHNTVGAAVHVALARWWDQAVGRRTPERGAALVVQAWQHDGFRDEEQSSLWRLRAADWVRGYLERALDAPSPEVTAAALGAMPGAGVPTDDDVPSGDDVSTEGDDVTDDVPPLDPTDQPAGVERTVATHTDVLAVSGRVDRIDDRDGSLVVVDYKTGRHVPTAEDARCSPALALYALATSRTLHRTCRRVELHHLPTGTVAAAQHTPASLARHVARAEATAHDIVAATDTLAAGADPDAVFPTVTGPGCAWCDMRRHCPDGQRAAPARASWDGLFDAGE